MELMWLLIALVIGSVLYKYFTGHGGMKISRAAIEGLPQEGALSVGGAEVRWSATEPDVLAVAWPLRMVVLSARPRGGEIAAILLSLRDLTDFVQCCVGKAGFRTTKPAPCRLALNKIASNLSPRK